MADTHNSDTTQQASHINRAPFVTRPSVDNIDGEGRQSTSNGSEHALKTHDRPASSATSMSAATVAANPDEDHLFTPPQPETVQDPFAAAAEGPGFMYEHFAEEQTLEAEDDDNDSALGSDTESTTTTLSESIFNYRREHGRTYHAYKDGKYIFPNDEREADRLDLQHHLFYLTFAGQLHFAPVNKPSHALDVGTGTGIWAVDFADQYPECQVIGIDLSPGQPTLIPPNLKFVVDDAEDLWVYHHKFDYIHGRLMAGCFGDWPHFFRQAYEWVVCTTVTKFELTDAETSNLVAG